MNIYEKADYAGGHTNTQGFKRLVIPSVDDTVLIHWVFRRRQRERHGRHVCVSSFKGSLTELSLSTADSYVKLLSIMFFDSGF